MNKCGAYGGTCDIYGVRRKIAWFGPKQVANARYEGAWGARRTCLHFATYWGFPCPRIITLLAENGANLDPKDDQGETPLRSAISLRYYESIKILIKFGASLEKAKVADFGQLMFDASMREEQTKAAIAEGQRLAGENRK